VTNDYVGIMFDGMFTDFGITHDALVRQGARAEVKDSGLDGRPDIPRE